MICPHGHDEGMIERLATPEEVDAGAELGIAFYPCPICAAAQDIIDGKVLICGRDTGRSAIRKEVQRRLDARVDAEVDTLLGVPMDDYDHQAEQGQGPPA